MQKEINFTIKALKDLPSAEKGKRYSVKDTKEDGLIIRVSDVGNKMLTL